MSDRIGRIARDQEGTAAVEFAIVSPVLLLMLLGMIAYAIYFGAVHSTAQLAADAARAAVAGLTDTERTAIATQQVATDSRSYALLLDPTRLTVNAAPLLGDPTEFQVSISYDARALPIWNLLTGLPLPSQSIVRTATIKHGGY